MWRPWFLARRAARRAPAGAQGFTALDPELRSAVVAFLREWLPPAAREEYRRMIRDDPDHWAENPHFRGEVIVRHALRGNGWTERRLGIDDLERYWAEWLRDAVLEVASDPGTGEADQPPAPQRTAG